MTANENLDMDEIRASHLDKNDRSLMGNLVYFLECEDCWYFILIYVITWTFEHFCVIELCLCSYVCEEYSDILLYNLILYAMLPLILARECDTQLSICVMLTQILSEKRRNLSSTDSE